LRVFVLNLSGLNLGVELNEHADRWLMRDGEWLV
jgi:hypothetical protein